MATTEYADFNGKWELDAALSDPPDEMLSMQGVGWLRRKMASAAQSLVATTVDMTPERMKVEINTPVMNRSEEFLLDGTPVTKDEDFLGIGSVTITSTWEDDKKTIKQVYEYPTGVNTVHRTLDGSLMVLRAYWEGKDGQVCTIRRVFRRVQ